MLSLIRDACGLSDDDIAGGSGWLSHDLFDIVAKVPQARLRQPRSDRLRSHCQQRRTEDDAGRLQTRSERAPPLHE